MTVRLIAVTKPVVDEVQTSDQLLAFFARVSNTANQLNHETGPKLIRSLIRREEWSPLEMVSATMEIETTRDISRQILRHRSFSFQEFSQRYAIPSKLGPPREARMQDYKDRQNSIETEDVAIKEWWEAQQSTISFMANVTYNEAVQMGIAKEVARAVLPEGLTSTKLYMAGTLRSWVHYCALRSRPGTQKEHREIALGCWLAISEHFTSVELPT